jgi:hypothetical protein
MKPPFFFIHQPLLFNSTKKMVESPIKFPSRESSSEDDLPVCQCSKANVFSDDWMSSDWSPSWSSEKVDQCNTLGVYHQLSSGFELKYGRLSGVADVKAKCMKMSPT